MLQALGFHDIGVPRATMIKGVDVLLNAFWIDVNNEVHIGFGGHGVPKVVHGLKLPPSIDVHQWKRWRAGVEGFARQVQHDGRVFANRVKHHGVIGMRHHFSDDIKALGLKPV